MFIACKEARETLYWLRLLIATDIIGESKLESLQTEADAPVSILTTTIKNAKA